MRTEQPHWFKSSVVTLTDSECMDVLRGNQVGRVIFQDGIGPVALPVNYAMEDGDVVFRTVEGGSIALNTEKRPVAFEVDEIDDYTESGCSVIVRGLAVVSPESAPASEDGPTSWAEGERPCVIRIRPHTVAGRRLMPT